MERSTFQHFVHVVDGFSEPQISRERESLQDWEGQVEGVQHLCHHDLVMPAVPNQMLQELIKIDQSSVKKYANKMQWEGRRPPTFGTRLKHFEAIYLTNCQAKPAYKCRQTCHQWHQSPVQALRSPTHPRRTATCPREDWGKSKSSNPKPYGCV